MLQSILNYDLLLLQEFQLERLEILTLKNDTTLTNIIFAKKSKGILVW